MKHPRATSLPPTKIAFSLVELSIVLVILGLLIGGILAGKALIQAATIRSQITQIDKLRVATNAFRDKYFGLPGDLQLATAQSLGFYTTGYAGNAVGQRDGNGIIERYTSQQYYIIDREFQLYWFDLSQSGLIEATLPNSGATPTPGGGTPNLNLTPGATYVGAYLPTAAIGNGSFVYITYANPSQINVTNNAVNITGGFNYFTISAVTASISGACVNSNAGLSVAQAYNIDMKIDDGIPNTGNTIAQYVTCNPTYMTSSSGADSSSTCWNNTTNAYSISQNNGEGINCGLSFKMR